MSSKVKNLILVLTLIIIAIAAFLFIQFSNDHKECGNIQEVKITSRGTQVISSQHICKEHFNF